MNDDTILPMTGERSSSLDAALTALLLHEWHVVHTRQGHYTVSIKDQYGTDVYGKGESQLTDAIWSAIRKIREGLRNG